MYVFTPVGAIASTKINRAALPSTPTNLRERPLVPNKYRPVKTFIFTAMSSKYKFANNGQVYFVSFAVVYWIDLFTRTDYCKTIMESFSFCEQKKGLELYSYCIMPSHLHLIIGSNKDPLEGIMRDFKSFTSRAIREAIQNHPGESRKEWLLWMMKRAAGKSSHHNEFQLWQEGNHPIELSTPTITKQKLDYIHNNPVEAGLVTAPEYWRYSSASNYSQLSSERHVILLGPFYN